eukprot:2650991-Rhodomonas_salina.1
MASCSAASECDDDRIPGSYAPPDGSWRAVAAASRRSELHCNVRLASVTDPRGSLARPGTVSAHGDGKPRAGHACGASAVGGRALTCPQDPTPPNSRDARQRTRRPVSPADHPDAAAAG